MTLNDLKRKTQADFTAWLGEQGDVTQSRAVAVIAELSEGIAEAWYIYRDKASA